MAVRSRRVATLTSVPASQNGWLLLYTVPAERTLIVKDWYIVNRTGSGRTLALAVRTGGLEARIHAGGLVATGTALAAAGRDTVLHAGEELVLFVGGENASTAIDGVVSGALLQGVPL